MFRDQVAPMLTRERLAMMLPTRRQVKLFLVVFLIIMMLGSAFSLAANAAGETDCVADKSCTPTSVMQPGDIIPLADMSEGGNKTLFETYGFNVWFIDSELNGTWADDLLDQIFHGIVNLLWYFVLLVVYMAIGICWWLFSSLDVPGLSDATNTLMTSASGALLAWVFPTALAIGGVVAYIQGKQANGGYVGQIAWMAAAGILAIGLAQDSGVWTNAVSQVRETGSNMILSASADAITADNSMPFAWPEVDYSVNQSEDKMLRMSGDSIWRTLVATPWCMIEFGSVEACGRYGPLMLSKGDNTKEREKVITDVVYVVEGNGDGGAGKDSATGQWTKGEDWPQRLGIVVMALLAALMFVVLILVLGFSALAGVILTALLLFAGVFFAALWMIPGKPRQWGVGWAETLVGAIMITFVALLTFGGVLALLTALYAASATAGWAVSMGLGLVLLLVAYGFRKQLADIVSARGTGAGRAFLVGAMLTRGGAKMLGGTGGRLKQNAITTARNTAKVARGTARAVRGTAHGVRVGGAAAGRYAAKAARATPAALAYTGRTLAEYSGAKDVYAAVRSRAVGAGAARSAARSANKPSPTSIRPGGLRPGPGVKPGPRTAAPRVRSTITRDRTAPPAQPQRAATPSTSGRVQSRPSAQLRNRQSSQGSQSSKPAQPPAQPPRRGRRNRGDS